MWFSVKDCGENHSGRNCVVEQRSAANCVPQSICGNCSAAAAADVLPRNPLAGWYLRSVWSGELRWTRKRRRRGAGINHCAAALRYSHDLLDLSSTISMFSGGFALQPVQVTNLRSKISQIRWKRVCFAMNEDEILFLRYSQYSLKSEARRSTKKKEFSHITAVKSIPLTNHRPDGTEYPSNKPQTSVCSSDDASQPTTSGLN